MESLKITYNYNIHLEQNPHSLLLPIYQVVVILMSHILGDMLFNTNIILHGVLCVTSYAKFKGNMYVMFVSVLIKTFPSLKHGAGWEISIRFTPGTGDVCNVVGQRRRIPPIPL